MMTFVNLPVKDLPKTIEFFTSLGFSFNEQFSSEETACMVLSDEAYVMLHVEPAFKGFAQQEITDTSQSREVIVGLSADSREQVDDLVAKVVAGEGRRWASRWTTGSCTCRRSATFDGHQWSFIYMVMTPGAAQPLVSDCRRLDYQGLTGSPGVDASAGVADAGHRSLATWRSG